MDSPETWRWIWLIATVVFALGEMSMAGTFFLLPFALGALVACLLAFLGAGVGIEWLAFVGVSAVASVGLIPLRRRLDAADEGRDEGIGARRMVGQPALVVSSIGAGPHGRGTVRVGREEWRAETEDGHAVAVGTVVKVVGLRGTGVVVTSVPIHGPRTPPGLPERPPPRRPPSPPGAS